MNLKETLLRGIYGYGFEKPSAIQQRAIMPCIEGNDYKATVLVNFKQGCGVGKFFAHTHTASFFKDC